MKANPFAAVFPSNTLLFTGAVLAIIAALGLVALLSQ
jgi:hypothetical protein